MSRFAELLMIAFVPMLVSLFSAPLDVGSDDERVAGEDRNIELSGAVDAIDQTEDDNQVV